MFFYPQIPKNRLNTKQPRSKSKLEAYNLDKNALFWFKSHLTDRTQLVLFMGQSLSIRTVTAYVLQGSMLGPLLFIMFINDLPSHVNTQVDIFADDNTLLVPSDFAHVEDLVNTLS